MTCSVEFFWAKTNQPLFSFDTSKRHKDFQTQHTKTIKQTQAISSQYFLVSIYQSIDKCLEKALCVWSVVTLIDTPHDVIR